EYAPFLSRVGQPPEAAQPTRRLRGRSAWVAPPPAADPPYSTAVTPTRLAGNNFAIRRELLSEDRDDLHEFEVYARAIAAGGRVVETAHAIAIHARRYSASAAI